MREAHEDAAGTKAAAARLHARRIDLPAEWVGLAPAPPCPLHLKFLPVGSQWTVLALTPPGMPAKVAQWLESFGPTAVLIPPGLTPKVARARFDGLPEPWQRMLSEVFVHYIELTPEGSASIFVQDSAEKIRRFLASISGATDQIRERKTLSDARPVELTARQLEVLSLAVALGYYESPHEVNLRDLAKKQGISVGTLSELLRRGESLIITNYIDSLSEARWGETDEPRGPAPRDEPAVHRRKPRGRP